MPFTIVNTDFRITIMLNTYCGYVNKITVDYSTKLQ